MYNKTLKNGMLGSIGVHRHRTSSCDPVSTKQGLPIFGTVAEKPGGCSFFFGYHRTVSNLGYLLGEPLA